jgi:hypothetical protein
LSFLRLAGSESQPIYSATANQAEAAVDTDQAFLRLLDQFEKEGRPVSFKTAPNYAPKLFSEHPNANRISKRRRREGDQAF